MTGPSADEAVVAAWSAVAPGYADYWGPRFRPFARAALDRLTAFIASGPGGAIAVVGCGPGEEALELAARFPAREVIAMDPSAPMLERLRAQLALPGAPSNVRAALAGATDLPDHAPDAAAVVSTFVLQLLDRPLDAFSAWTPALAPGGLVAALFWPRQDPSSSWGRLRPAIETETPAWRPEWEEEAWARLPALGLEPLARDDVTLPMLHASPEEAWARLVDSGSLQGLARRVPPDVLERVRARWLADHRLTRTDAGWTHAPTARLWLAQRRP